MNPGVCAASAQRKSRKWQKGAILDPLLTAPSTHSTSRFRFEGLEERGAGWGGNQGSGLRMKQITVATKQLMQTLTR